MQVPLLRCPYCDYITQTDQRLMEHIKAHAPTKAYKCTLCGYRGNTVRGMRMHGKTHMDAGENFTDEHMVEFEEPPLIPKRIKTVMPDNPLVDLEAELIRLKNEPYKRRRSRKSYEKVDVPIRHHTPNVCILCNEVLPDGDHLHHHLRTQHADTIHTCKRCHFFTDDKQVLAAHVRMHHDPEHQPDEATDSGDPYRYLKPAHYPPHISPQPNIHTKTDMSPMRSIKQEQEHSHSETSRSPVNIKTEERVSPFSTSPSENPPSSSLPEYSGDRDPRNTLEHEVQQSVKTREDSPQSSSRVAQDNDMGNRCHSEEKESSLDVKQELKDNGQDGDECVEQTDVDTDERTAHTSTPGPTYNGVKTERRWSSGSPTNESEAPSTADENCNGISHAFKGLAHDSQDLKTVLRKASLNAPYSPNQSPLSNVKNEPKTLDSAVTSSNGSRTSASPGERDTNHSPPSSVTPADEKPSSRFCNQCQISFMYVSTYVAHKKHYCTSRTIEENKQPTDVV